MRIRERTKGIALVGAIFIWGWFTMSYMGDALVRLNIAVA